MCEKVEAEKADFKSVGALPQDDVDQRSSARATAITDLTPKTVEDDIPPKKRKTRRGKPKRRYNHPYVKIDRKANKINKAQAPHNSNAFLIEDHGTIVELDEKLKHNDAASTSTVNRTRDSSFSMESDGEFYSSPDDEAEFLTKDFDDQYQSLHVERLYSLSKNELVQEYLLMENKVETLTNRLNGKFAGVDTGNKACSEVKITENNVHELQEEVEQLKMEIESLKRENDDLRSKISVSSSDSEDSETDSSDSCSSSSSESRSESPVVDYTQTNGHSPNIQSV